MSESLSTEAVLRDVLHATEEVVRALDIKTEIAMLCFVISVEAAEPLGAFEGLGSRPVLAGLLFALFIAVLIAYMLVLFPVQNPRFAGGGKAGDEVREAIGSIYFVDDPQRVTAGELVRAASRHDHAHDVADEILKVSYIRNSKRRRFICALILTLAFYGVLLGSRFVA